MIRSLRNQILAISAGLIAVAAITILAVMLYSTGQATRLSINNDLIRGLSLFNQLLDARKTQLGILADVLVADFGFKQAVATGDNETIRSMLNNHLKRVNADVLFIVDLNGKVLASSSERVQEQAHLDNPGILENLRKTGKSQEFLAFDKQIYQMIFLPVKAPGIIAYAAIGFVVNEKFAQDIASLSQLEVSFVLSQKLESQSQSHITIVSTLDKQDWALALNSPSVVDTVLRLPLMIQQAFVSRPVALSHYEQANIDAILSESLGAAFKGFDELRDKILIISTVIVAIAIMGGSVLSSNLTVPLQQLVKSLDQFAKGQFTQATLSSRSSQEITQLHSAFMHMAKTLQERESRILFQAKHDVLTGLLNRNFIVAAVDEWLAQHRDISAVLINVNLIGFKNINDAFGPQIGDACLQHIANLLNQYQGGSAICARMAADEFVVFLPLVGSPLDVCSDLQIYLATPFELDAINVPLRANMGAAEAPAQGTHAALLLRRANLALEHARAQGLPVRLYSQADEEFFLGRLQLLQDLKYALSSNDGQLCMYYQPKLRLQTSIVDKFEALIRWFHPRRGFVPPDEFIALAEQSGLIQQVTEWVIAQVIQQLDIWMQQGESICVAVNISAQDLARENLLQQLTEQLQKRGLTSQHLCLELTERDTMEDADLAQALMLKFKEAGFYLSVDDYGIGYSSLSKLKQMPINELKIDKHFVLNLDKSDTDQIIVRSTIELAHSFNLIVVAEGVENQASQDILHNMGCDYIQGYYLAKPMSAANVCPWLTQHRKTHGVEKVKTAGDISNNYESLSHDPLSHNPSPQRPVNSAQENSAQKKSA